MNKGFIIIAISFVRKVYWDKDWDPMGYNKKVIQIGSTCEWLDMKLIGDTRTTHFNILFNIHPS